MLDAANFVTRHALNFLIGFTSFTLLTFASGDNSSLVLLLAVLSYFISNGVIKAIQKLRICKKLGLSRSEYKHIEDQIRQAKGHIHSLSQQYIRVRSVRSFKLLNEMLKLSKRIVSTVQVNPQKFYSVEDFFYSHLPSTVQLIQTYTMLSQSPVKDTEVHLALEETRKTLKGLHAIMEDDLKCAIASDLESLRIELDFVKHESDKKLQQINLRGEK